MEDGTGCYIKIIFLIIFLSGYLPGGVNTQSTIPHLKPLKLLHSYKVLKGKSDFSYYELLRDFHMLNCVDRFCYVSVLDI